MKKGSGSPSRPSNSQVHTCPPQQPDASHYQAPPPAGGDHQQLWSRCSPLTSAPLVSLQVNPERRRLMRGGTLDVDGGPRPRGRHLGRRHTLDAAHGTGLAAPDDAATEATPTLPCQTPSHAAPASADQLLDPSECGLRPPSGQGSHPEVNGDLRPRLLATQPDGQTTLN